MPLRYTSTEKWKDEWYISLTNDYKLIWLWLNDNCNHAGILKKGVSMLNFSCKTNIKESDLMEVFGKKMIEIPEGYFIPEFLKLQYRNLTSSKPAILSVKRILVELNLVDLVRELFGQDFIKINDLSDNGCQTIKDKDKDKEENEEEFNDEIPTNFIGRN